MDINKNYDKFNSKQTYDAVGELVKEIEYEKDLKAMYGRIAGSKTQGISSRASDNDFLIFCSKGKDNMDNEIEGQIFKEAIVNGARVEFEIGYIYMDAVLKDVHKRYYAEYTGYPTNFYRSKEEEEYYLPQNIPKLMRQRKEYAFVMFHLFLLGDTIWANEDYHQYDFNELYKLVKTIDMLDTFFVRAYGNYQYYFKGQSEVLVRKYLYAISQVCAIEWLLTKRTRPPMDFMALIEGQIEEDEVRQHIDRIIQLNKNSNLYKSKYYEEADQVLNTYILSKLIYAKENIERYNRTETYADIIKNTKPSQRQKIYDERYHDWRKQ